MNKNTRSYHLAVMVYCFVCGAMPVAWVMAQKPKVVVKRAQPPKFEKTDSTFFSNAFTEGLSGERPADLGKPMPAVVANNSAGNSGTPASSGSGGDNSWAALISPTAMEDEIKSQKSAAEKSITTPTDFTSNGYKFARREFSVTAMIFAVIAEYGGDEVRWKKEALTERDAFARTAANAKVGTIGVYNEAKQRREELEGLLSGQGVTVRSDVEEKPNWPQICNRAPLMQRLEANFDSKIKAWTADKGTFTANLENLEHEAQIFALIGAVITKEGMEDGDDAEYKKFADALKQGSVDLTKACRDKDHAAASKAASVISVSCDKCHEGYR